MLENNNNHNNASCAFAEQTVSYLYGEVNAVEKTVFETHLKSCAACSEEFAGFGAIRSSISEWRNEEFLSLATPSIEIPYENTQGFYNSKTVSPASSSWFDKLRNFWSHSPALTASASFAVIAICIGIIFFANKSSNDLEVAGFDNKNTEKTFASPTVDEEMKPTLSTTDAPEKSIAEPNNGNQEMVSQKNTTRKSTVVKAVNSSGNTVKGSNLTANTPKIKEVNSGNKKMLAVQTNKIPRLNNVEEDEDESLRLAELLDDGGDIE